MFLLILTTSLCCRSRTSASDDNPNPPDTRRQTYLHPPLHRRELADGWLWQPGKTLDQNNYFVSDTNYGWGPNSIGDRTDIPDWMEWFQSANTPTYMAALYNEYDQHSSYTRTLADPGGENEIILFKSCFPNSALEGSPNDLPDPTPGLTVGHAKYVYNTCSTISLPTPKNYSLSSLLRRLPTGRMPRTRAPSITGWSITGCGKITIPKATWLSSIFIMC